MKISYEYQVQKIAYVPGQKGELIPVGIFEQSSREGDLCKMTVKIFPGIPEKLIELIKENPQILMMRENKMKAHPVVMLPEGHDSLIIPKG